MSWKDKWTAFWWKFCFPGEEIPLEILPSNYARLEKKVERKLTLGDALTKACIMDMQMYPSQWERLTPRWTYDDTKYVNKTSNVEIVSSGTSTFPKVTINGVLIDKENSIKLITAFQNRWGAEVLERLLNRIEKVKEITVEQVIEEVRPKTIDPFSPTSMDKLADTIENLKLAAHKGANLPPPPKQLPKVTKAVNIRSIKNRDETLNKTYMQARKRAL